MLFSVATAAGLLPAALWKEDAEKPGLHYGFRMRSAPALLIGAVVALTLVACVPDDEPVRPDPSPTAEPIFASDEEALAAAEEAYAAYLAVSDQILQDGGLEPDRLLHVATEKLYADAIGGFDKFASNGWRAVGSTAFDSLQLQSYDASAPPGEPLVVIYACVDLSGIDVIDSSGVSVVSATRVSRSPYQVALTLVDVDDPDLLVAGDEPWDGGDYCDFD